MDDSIRREFFKLLYEMAVSGQNPDVEISIDGRQLGDDELAELIQELKGSSIKQVERTPPAKSGRWNYIREFYLTDVFIAYAIGNWIGIAIALYFRR